jgi:hypothetical protein
MVNFKNVKVNPATGPSGVNFIYHIEVDSALYAFDVELFVTPPETSNSNEVSLGIRKYNQSNRLLKWGPTKLNCTYFGNGTYRFWVGPPINGFSKSYDGPYVPIYISSHSNTDTINGSVHTSKHCTEVLSCVNATIKPFVSDPSIKSEPIIASDNFQLICWNSTHKWAPGVEDMIRDR